MHPRADARRRFDVGPLVLLNILLWLLTNVCWCSDRNRTPPQRKPIRPNRLPKGVSRERYLLRTARPAPDSLLVPRGLIVDGPLLVRIERGGEMVRAAAFVTLTLALAGLLTTAASADPLNGNSATITFACDNGVTYTGTATVQSHTSTGHVIAASDPSLLHSVFQAVQITVGGEVVKQIPGFAGRTLINCTITAFGADPATGPPIVTTGFFTGPR